MNRKYNPNLFRLVSLEKDIFFNEKMFLNLDESAHMEDKMMNHLEENDKAAKQ